MTQLTVKPIYLYRRLEQDSQMPANSTTTEAKNSQTERVNLGADHGAFVGSTFQETIDIYRKNARHIAALIIVAAIGMLYFGPAEGWDFNQSLFFVVTTVTTVGYGYLHPTFGNYCN